MAQHRPVLAGFVGSARALGTQVPAWGSPIPAALVPLVRWLASGYSTVSGLGINQYLVMADWSLHRPDRASRYRNIQHCLLTYMGVFL